MPLIETAFDLKIYGENLKTSNTEKYLGIPISQQGVKFGKLAKERTYKEKWVIIGKTSGLHRKLCQDYKSRLLGQLWNMEF